MAQHEVLRPVGLGSRARRGPREGTLTICGTMGHGAARPMTTSAGGVGQCACGFGSGGSDPIRGCCVSTEPIPLYIASQRFDR